MRFVRTCAVVAVVAIVAVLPITGAAATAERRTSSVWSAQRVIGHDFSADSRAQVGVDAAGRAYAWWNNVGERPNRTTQVGVGAIHQPWHLGGGGAYSNGADVALLPSGTTLSTFYDYGLEHTAYRTRRPYGTWSAEREFVVPGVTGPYQVTHSASGFVAARGGSLERTSVALREPDGTWRAPIPLPRPAHSADDDRLAVADDGSFVYAADADDPANPGRCHVVYLYAYDAAGHPQPRVAAARRCTPGGGSTLFDLVPFSSGDGAALTWLTDDRAVSTSRVGVAVRVAPAKWESHLQPSLGRRAYRTVTATAGQVWVWWFARTERALTLYSSVRQAGRWSSPAVVHTYPAATNVLRLVSAVGAGTGHGDGTRIVAWTVQPRRGGLFDSRLRTCLHDGCHEESLGGLVTVQSAAVAGGHAALLMTKQTHGADDQDVIVRQR